MIVSLVWIHEYTFSLLSEIKRKRRRALLAEAHGLFLPWTMAYGLRPPGLLSSGKDVQPAHSVPGWEWTWRRSSCWIPGFWGRRASTGPRAINRHVPFKHQGPFSWSDQFKTLERYRHTNRLKVRSAFAPSPPLWDDPAVAVRTCRVFKHSTDIHPGMFAFK